MSQGVYREKYILYCAQDANFCTRSMLISYDLIMKCEERVKDLEVLRANALRDVPFEHRGQKYVVDQLLVQNITWTGNHGRPDDNAFIEITTDFTHYADGIDEDEICKEYDRVWANDIICGVASSGFNNVTNYCNFRNKNRYKRKSIEIIEGFLVLESNNGKTSCMPSVDTVEEMYEKY